MQSQEHDSRNNHYEREEHGNQQQHRVGIVFRCVALVGHVRRDVESVWHFSAGQELHDGLHERRLNVDEDVDECGPDQLADSDFIFRWDGDQHEEHNEDNQLDESHDQLPYEPEVNHFVEKKRK